MKQSSWSVIMKRRRQAITRKYITAERIDVGCMTFANSFKFCYTSDEIPEGEMFTGWQTCKRTCEAREAREARSSRHIGFTFSRFQDLCLSKRTIGNDWRKLSSSFPLTSRNEVYLWQASWDLFDVFGVASLFCFWLFVLCFSQRSLVLQFSGVRS